MFVFAVIVIALSLGIAFVAGYFKKKPGEKYPGENVPEEGTKA